MRLVRFPGKPARVSDDIRAALTSLGRGHNVVGGIGLVGVQPPGALEPVDAVLVLPHGVLVVVGVDLPDPGMKLDAPLDEQWRSDGWPIVCKDNAVNPSAEPLTRARALCERAHTLQPRTAVGVVVGVGPFVETIEQPPADLTGTVRVIHPTAASMLAATISLAHAEHTFSADEARALIREFEPTAPEHSDDVFEAEGFTTDKHPLAVPSWTVPVDYPQDVKPLPATAKKGAAAPETAGTTVATPAPGTHTVPVSTPSPQPRPKPVVPATVAVGAIRQQPRPQATRGSRPWRPRGWQPFAALAVLVVAIAAVLTVVTSSGDDNADTGGSGTDAVAAKPPTVAAGGVEFTQRATGSTASCSAHAAGDLEVELRNGCVSLRRGSFEATVEGRAVAASVASLTFDDEATATEFRELADSPGSGVVTDLGIEQGSWPKPAPTFENAAYESSASGVTVRVVLACHIEGQSRADDEALVDVAKAALDLPLPQ